MPCYDEGEFEARAEENKRYEKWASHIVLKTKNNWI
jgi:hypothetical protein